MKVFFCYSNKSGFIAPKKPSGAQWELLDSAFCSPIGWREPLARIFSQEETTFIGFLIKKSDPLSLLSLLHFYC